MVFEAWEVSYWLGGTWFQGKLLKDKHRIVQEQKHYYPWSSNETQQAG